MAFIEKIKLSDDHIKFMYEIFERIAAKREESKTG